MNSCFEFAGSWKSIANDEDVSDAVGENSARSLTHTDATTLRACDSSTWVRSPLLAGLLLLVEVVQPLF